jgi:hypothetical protein
LFYYLLFLLFIVYSLLRFTVFYCFVFQLGADDGLVEFVPSLPLSRVIQEHRTLHKYLALTQADPSGEGLGFRTFWV